uniref:Uncharacterized protein n=1 Tax=Micrurus carvalhoi TaxID=3147026 RepID=A0A2H6N0M5_9SAUR
MQYGVWEGLSYCKYAYITSPCRLLITEIRLSNIALYSRFREGTNAFLLTAFYFPIELSDKSEFCIRKRSTSMARELNHLCFIFQLSQELKIELIILLLLYVRVVSWSQKIDTQ